MIDPTSSLPSFIRQAWLFLTLALGAGGAAAYVFETEWQSAPELVVEISSDTSSTAQLFYDTGSGLNELESARAPISATNNVYTEIRFPLPDRPIRALRFDPLTGPGRFTLRRVYLTDPFGRIVHQFAAPNLVSLNQIASRADSTLEVTFWTVPGANDPMLQLPLTRPLSASVWRPSAIVQFLIGLALAVAITLVAGVVYFLVHRYGEWPGRQLDRVAAAVSDPYFLVFDRVAIGFYLTIAAIFIAAVSAGLHGSSQALFTSMGSGDDAVQPMLGWPKPIRADEWAYHTPSILYQVNRGTPFAIERGALGPDGAALISNVPIWHVSTLFRPQFWGFFVLPTPYAFAFYWQFKALLLLSGVFTLLLLLTRSSKLAALGALWFAVSPWVQWAYSWPSLVPELIGLFCLVMCATFYLAVGRRRDLLFAAAVVCASCAVNFALCAYVPHLIPLVWLGVFLCAWWVSVKWEDIVSRDYRLPRILAFGGAWLAVAIMMLVVVRDAQGALVTLANTSYPGQRSLPGGGYAMTMMFSHAFSFWADDVRFPGPYGNVCEWAGFFWLAPVTLFCLGRTGTDRYRRRAYWALLVFGALLFVWLTVPLPALIGQALFLDKTGSYRSQPALGFVNVALVMVFLSMWRKPVAQPARFAVVMLAAAAFAVLFSVFQVVNAAVANFLTIGQVTIAALYFTVLVVAIVENRRRLLAAFLLVPQFAAFALVNPIDRGLRVFESSPVFEFVRSRPELLEDRWLVYSRAWTDPGFFNAVGLDVLTGLDYVPDLQSLSVFDPTGAQRSIINRSVYFLAEPKYDDGPSTFELPEYQVVFWRVNPLDPRLRRIGVRYAAFAQAPPPHIAARMKALSPGPISGYWLYELP
jgi:hypothetical protein